MLAQERSRSIGYERGVTESADRHASAPPPSPSSSTRERAPLSFGRDLSKHPLRWPLLTVLLFAHRAFDYVALHPRPWLRLLLVVAIAAAPASVFVSRVDAHRLAERVLNQSGRMSESPEAERATLMENTAKTLKVALPGVAAARRLLFIFLVAALGFALLRGLVPGLSFRLVLSAVVVGTAPMLLHDLIKLAQAFGPHPLFLDLDNPVKSNPAALFDLDARKTALGALAKSLDLFRLWTVSLCATGLRAVTGKRSFIAGAAPWVIYGASVLLDVLGATLSA